MSELETTGVDASLPQDQSQEGHAFGQPIEVEQRVAQPVSQVWARLLTKDGVGALLGEGAELGGKGDPWHAADGTRGVTRSFHPEQQVRVSWHADEDAAPSLVDLQLSPDGDGTRLVLRHEHLPADLGDEEREQLRNRWTTALGRLADA